MRVEEKACDTAGCRSCMITLSFSETTRLRRPAEIRGMFKRTAHVYLEASFMRSSFSDLTLSSMGWVDELECCFLGHDLEVCVVKVNVVPPRLALLLLSLHGQLHEGFLCKWQVEAGKAKGSLELEKRITSRASIGNQPSEA